jgi:hypothetical protein
MPGLDDLVRSDFISFRDACFDWLLVATGVVALGLLFELPEIWHDSASAIRRLRGQTTGLTEIRPSIKLLISVGWLLIVIGVVGEFIADTFVSRADGIVQTFDETLLVDTQRKTGVASERAAEAFARAARAERDAEGFRLQIAQADERAADANRTAEVERLARVELEKQLEPRRLTTKQKKDLSDLLTNDPQTIMFGWCATGSDDCQDFVNDIGDAFKRAGWKTWFANSLQNKRGIQVGFTKDTDESLVQHWVPRIRNAFSQIGVPSEPAQFDATDRWLVGGFQKNVLYVIVGQKPAVKSTADREP